jgi:hypothetical protein
VSVRLPEMGKTSWFDEVPAKAAVERALPVARYARSLHERLGLAAELVTPAVAAQSLMRERETAPSRARAVPIARRLWWRRQDGRLS